MPGLNDDAERSDGRNITFRYATLWLTWVTTVAGVAGLVLTRRTQATRLLFVCAMYFTLISIPFSPMAPRLRASLDLVCCIAAGVVLHRCLGARTAEDGSGGAEVIDLTDVAMSGPVDELHQRAAGQ